MGSRDKDQTTSHHHPHLSSLVVRPPVSDEADGGGGGGGGGRGRGGGSDYEPGEVRHHPPPHSRPDRYNDEPGHRIRAGSSSPIRRRDADHRYGSNFDRLGGTPRNRDIGNGRDSVRYRDSSPRYGRGPAGGSSHTSRGSDGTAASFRYEGMTRNNLNVRPREGDWICPDPECRNLNFSRREYCNNCKRFRNAPAKGPRGGYPGPAPWNAPPRPFPGSSTHLSPPRRNMNGFRSPPRVWAREGPRDFGPGGPPPPIPLRHEGRFSDHNIRRDRSDYLDIDCRERNRFDRPMPIDWGHRDRGRDNFLNERKGYGRRPPSPPPPPDLAPRGRWHRDARVRSRSPIRGAPPLKEYHRDMYLERGREDRHGGDKGLCLKGPNAEWVRPPLPDPMNGINLLRDVMEEDEWLELVATSSDLWILELAFVYGATTYNITQEERIALYGLITGAQSIADALHEWNELQVFDQLGDLPPQPAGQQMGLDELGGPENLGGEAPPMP
ncbi:hypothetical protein GQ457_16G002690 [Hibiscus cannabinus]